MDDESGPWQCYRSERGQRVNVFLLEEDASAYASRRLLEDEAISIASEKPDALARELDKGSRQCKDLVIIVAD